ncbi:hypothetical protein [Nonomuraea rosea]
MEAGDREQRRHGEHAQQAEREPEIPRRVPQCAHQDRARAAQA